MTEYYVSGCIDNGSEVETCDDSEAKFWTLYERGDDGLSQGIIDCTFREDAEAAMRAYQERDALQQQLAQEQAQVKVLESLVKEYRGVKGDLEARVQGLEQQIAEVTTRGEYSTEQWWYQELLKLTDATDNLDLRRAVVGVIPGLIAQLALLEEQVNALGAENMDLKHPGTYLPSKRETPATDAIKRQWMAEGAIAVRDAIVIAEDGSNLYEICTKVAGQLRQPEDKDQ